ncbi:type II toxin-antitoxin system RnlB family antitoxin [Pseudomonas abietaniphila]|uniref:type II toxin-antitoxin system RnlB family antitoxin n=1 Tax=Pseudomonas abietaniphila TaxID=89065 RepID=UPI00078135E0|nr:type II toxin-antitoxin system RnlB family antitoxin [Pseudomonas abietaniphila]
MFDVRKLETREGFITVVTATSYENPLSRLSAIASVMRETSHSSNEAVLFDLLCTNGEEWNRFAFMQYNGQEFERTSFNIVSRDDISRDLLESQSNFFERHPEFIADSVLI